MRVISLNLDLEDAEILRRAIAGAMERRGENQLSTVDNDYRALHALAGELDRLLSGPRPSRFSMAVNGGPVDATAHLTVIPGGLVQE
jgi:hypothetical protein